MKRCYANLHVIKIDFSPFLIDNAVKLFSSGDEVRHKPSPGIGGMITSTGFDW